MGGVKQLFEQKEARLRSECDAATREAADASAARAALEAQVGVEAGARGGGGGAGTPRQHTGVVQEGAAGLGVSAKLR